MALYRIDRGSWAQREWDDALSRYDDTQRRLAVEVAQDNGWFDRGVFGLGTVSGKSRPDELRRRQNTDFRCLLLCLADAKMR